ncbi:cytochrome P450 [Amycolatopsis sp. K13G38]|uniref:Cytochrome P450 n=1 Tax=Amycolatopsis acididurans TaxID=2724524 RepID=A0ABX1JCS2_9PSEU|nr:cytochrome P450 [Amycolatopsis acididurans]NKQ56185.1 cytochrome P450 [Amycolatopsis acididurans]
MTKAAVERNVDYASIKGLTVLRSYEDINFVLKSPDFVQLKGDVPEIGRPFNRGTLLSLNGAEHLARRRLYSPLFSNDALSYLYHRAARPVIVEALHNVYRAAQDASARPAADLAKLVPLMLYRVSARVAGVDGIDTDEDVHAFTNVIERYAKGISIEFFDNPESFVQEALAGKEELRKRYLEPCTARRRELVEAFRAGRLEKSDLPRDLITLWLLNDESLLKGESPEQEEYLLVEFELFLYTGTRTTQRLLPHVIQAITDWVAAHPEDATRTTESAFLRGAIAETLRFHGLPAMQRRAIRDVVLPSGAQIAAREMIALDYVDANKDPNVFGEDAAEWNPYRIERGIKGAPWGMSFGGGAHMCIGRRLVTGGDWRKGSSADDRHIDGTVVAIVRAMFEAGVRPDTDSESVSHGQAHLSQFDEYVAYPVVFDRIEEFVASTKETAAS